MKTKNIIGLAALASILTLVFIFSACKTDIADEPDPPLQQVFENITTDGTIYRLTIIQKTNRAAYTPAPGDKYILEIIKDGVIVNTSTGTVQVFIDDIITLKPSNTGAENFIIQVSDEEITDISGPIAVEGSTTPVPAPPPGSFATVTGVTVTPSSATVARDGTQQFTAIVTGTNNPAQTVAWTVTTNQGNVNGTSISETGLLTVGPNQNPTTLIVTATSTVDTTKSGTASVTVPNPGNSGQIAVTGVSLNKTTLNLIVNGTETLTATVAPGNATNKSVTWASSAPAVATVNSSGLVTAVSMGTATITITTADGDKTTECAVTVSAGTPTKTLTGITLDTSSVKKAYAQGETLDLSGLAVTANYSDGSGTSATSYTSSPVDGATFSTAGIITVTISYSEGTITRSANFTVTVSGETPTKTLNSISLNHTSVKKAYTEGEMLNLSGLVVTASYSDGSGAAVTGYISSPADGSTLTTTGTITVTISYTDGGVTQPATFTVTVTSGSIPPIKTLTGITLNTSSVKIAYTQNETLDLSGLVVIAYYSDGSGAAVTDYISSPAGGSTLSTTGTITVTISYTEGMVTENAGFSVTVTISGGLIGQISGVVVDSITQLPLADVEVELSIISVKTTTHAHGTYKFSDVPIGQHELIFYKEGYQFFIMQQVVDPAENKIVSVSLVPLTGRITGTIKLAKFSQDYFIQNTPDAGDFVAIQDGVGLWVKPDTKPDSSFGILYGPFFTSGGGFSIEGIPAVGGFEIMCNRFEQGGLYYSGNTISEWDGKEFVDVIITTGYEGFKNYSLYLFPDEGFFTITESNTERIALDEVL